MKLYYVPMTRSLRPRWMLEELGVPHELVRLDPKAGDNKTPAYLALNPTGHVPTLVDGEVVLFESAAMLLYLGDKYADKGLAPAIVASADRAEYLKWIVYGMAELEPGLAATFAHGFRLPEDRRKADVLAWGREKAKGAMGPLAARLAGREFLVGERFTAADVLLGSQLGWARMMGLVEDEVLAGYLKRVMARPAAVRARAD